MDQRAQTPETPSSSCACCATPTDRPLNRRRFLSLAGAGLIAGFSMPRQAVAEDICETREQYKAMVLSCIDPRMQEPVAQYLTKRELVCSYSQITIAGAAIGAVAPRFKNWHSTFWDNLSITLALHRIPKVIVINHRRCGAATEAYGPFEYDSEAETRLHKAVLADFREQILERHPQLDVETLLMGLYGRVEKLS